MEHSFNVQFAQKYGIEEAIIVHNFYFWLRKNIANEKHLHNGRYWTYNSNNAFTQLFPYINKTKIFRVLKHLEECDIILKDNFNTSVWDKTLWYSFSDHGLCELYAFGYDVTDFGKMNHRDNQSETTIPYNKHTDNNKEKEIDKSISKKDEESEFIDRMYALYPAKCPKRGTTTGKSHKDKQRIKKLLKAYTMEEIEKVFQHEIDEKYDKQYMQNFSTFLNNFPDINSLEQDLFVEETSKKDDKLIIGGTVYR
ncbi:MAG: hypothetical protein II304_00825 [Bacteroidales bacterium]|nr:hypothetical protein [Bacteroidales bacterium]